MPTTNNARSRGPQPPAATVYRRHEALYSPLHAAALRTLQVGLIAHDVSPLAVDIATSVHRRHRAAAMLLARLRCRWNELSQLDLAEVAETSEIRLVSSKGGCAYPVVRLTSAEAELWQAVDWSAPLYLTSYARLCHDVRQQVTVTAPWLPDSCNSATHVFRHLHATYLAGLGRPLKEIAASLGQSSTLATQRYVHDFVNLL